MDNNLIYLKKMEKAAVKNNFEKFMYFAIKLYKFWKKQGG